MTPKKFTKEATVRAIITAVAVLNMILVALGHDKVEICEETVYQLVSAVFLIASVARSYWKNNSATIGHKFGDKVAKIINNGNLDFLAEVTAIVDKYEHLFDGSECREVTDNGKEEI